MKADGNGGDGNGANGRGANGSGGNGAPVEEHGAEERSDRPERPALAPEDAHWTRESLWSMFGDGERASEVLAAVLEHLAAICPRCREELAAYTAVLQRDERQGPATYGQAFDRVLARLPAAAAATVREEEQAAAAAAALRELPASARRQAVLAESERYRGPALAAVLLAEARAVMPGEPRQARTFLRLARQVLDHTPSSPATVELYARVLAHLGNVHRVLEDLEGAGRLLTLARDLADSHGPPEPALEAEIDHLEASLRRAERRLPEAVRLLIRAADTYREIDQPEGAATALLTLGLTHRETGELAAAEEVTRQAIALLGAHSDPRLVRMARHNLALFLSDAGRHREARFALRQAQGLARDDRYPWTRLRFLWLEGRIAAGLGEDEAASGAFHAVRAGFLKEGLPYDAALVSLDLAALLHRQGCPAEVRELAEEMGTIFGGKGIHREATAALLFFVQAARQEAVTAALLEQVTAYLQAARHNPALTFQPPEA